MTKIDIKAPVMITGATGFVAGWVVSRLLQNGHTVHAPIRSPENPGKTKYLDQLADKFPGNIKYFKADLLDEGSYDEAMRGCELVIHTASPFSLDIDDPQKDLVDPALGGTRNILRSAQRTPSVKRVVLTSSCAAIYGDNKDLQQLPHHTITEEHWNETSSLDHQPYSYSKTVAEREAWKIAGEQTQWDLVVINPSLVIGPGINPHASSESFTIIQQMGDGTMKMGTIDLEIGCVDVRDVADAHYNAGFDPEASGRHILSGENYSFLQLAKDLRDHYGDQYPFPKKTLPKWLVWLVGPMQGMARKAVSRNIGYPWRADNSKSKAELNIVYGPIKQATIEMFEQMQLVGRV